MFDERLSPVIRFSLSYRKDGLANFRELLVDLPVGEADDGDALGLKEPGALLILLEGIFLKNVGSRPAR